MRIATFNANSVRVRLDHILDWLAENDPDIFCIQELKCEDAQFPGLAFEEAGYSTFVSGQKAQNGVAILYRGHASDFQRGFPNPSMPQDARLQAATIDGVRVINTYVPNGTQVGSEKFRYKLSWLEEFRNYLAQELRTHSHLVWLGDINIARHPLDVHNSPRALGGVGHHPQEFERLDAVLQLGLTDAFRHFTAEGGHYTFWEFVDRRAFDANRGWRIDHIYLSPQLLNQCTNCWIDRSLRALERPSDHTVVVADFS